MLLGLILGVLFVTPFVVVYALFIRWCDRFEPEPWWLLSLAFVWGALFATVGGGLSSGIAQALTASVLGARLGSDGLEALGSTVFAPIFEELFKGFGVALIALASAVKLKELDGPLDGAIYGGIVGLGFTLTEDILYVANQFAEAGFGGFVVLLFLRTVLLGLSHCTFTAMTGLGFGIAVEARSLFVKIAAPLGGFVLAMAMHAFHNGMPTFFGKTGLLVMLLGSWAIDVLFFVLIALLVVRDRSIVLRELQSEVGQALHPTELGAVSTYFALSLRNLNVLFSGGFQAFRMRRRKQLALVELAFVKSRRRRGESGQELDQKEADIRRQLDFANRLGVWLGSLR